MAFPEQIYGPLGAVVVLSIIVTVFAKAIKVLWDDHQRANAEDRADRDAWKALALDSERDISRLTKVIERTFKLKVPPAP